MGIGDEIITTSYARRIFKETGRKSAIARLGYWSPVFDHNPKILREPELGCALLPWVTGCRPYIDYGRSDDKHFAWNWRFKAQPGELYFAPEELRHTMRGFVYIEPNVKNPDANKDWGFDRWQKVVDSMPHIPWVQGTGRKLAGVTQVETTSFRDACALLKNASLFVGVDGALHHASAALNVSAVVLWSGFVSPEILGYDQHVNLCHAEEFCGRYHRCQHCMDAYSRLTVDEVIDAVQRTYNAVDGFQREAGRLPASSGFGAEIGEAQDSSALVL